MISRGIRDFLDLRVFLVLKVFFHKSIAMKTMNITLLGHGSGLTGHLSFSINVFFNDLLLVVDIPISFIKERSDQGRLDISEIINEKLIHRRNLDIKLF